MRAPPPGPAAAGSTAESELSFCRESGFCWLLLQLFLSMSENTVFNAVLISFSRLDFETILDLQ